MHEEVEGDGETVAKEEACNDHSGASTTVHKLSKYVWFCCCWLETKWNEKTQLGQNMVQEQATELPPNAMMSEKLTCM